MSGTSREKAALIVFLGLIILSLFGFGWYLFAGHSWNVAASNIDDTFGSMEGYTAIVYPGTVLPEEDVVEDVAVPPDTISGQEAAKSTGTSPASSSPPTAPPTIPSLEDAPDVSTQSGEVETGSLSKKKSITLEQAKESYESKNAIVFSLDTMDLGLYQEGTILKKGSHRFGVFSVAPLASTIQVEKQITYFKRYAVDFLVAITPDMSLVKEVAGLDIVICTQDEGLFVMGETHGGTFYVDAPELGRIGAILISPSNVVSAKVIEEM